jgi:hypothetical protein
MVYSAKLVGPGVVEWNATGNPSGIYILKARVGEKTYSRRMVLQK